VSVRRLTKWYASLSGNLASSRPACIIRGMSEPPHLRLRLQLGRSVMIGPGKADLLAAVAATGSITAAGRSMGMSYKRAWLLVDTMNGCFREPLVIAAKGDREAVQVGHLTP